tara:strand:- start:176 stop:400 length:225 start_codon:yes stop_codon:yes gene_type:complete
MTDRQKKLYSSMNKDEQDMFDYLVHVEDKKPDDVFFFLHMTFQPSRDDFKKPSFANLSTRQVIATCKELERTAA